MAIPLTIIGGFLGSGKTTLLNRLLADPQGHRFAVIVNDFGAINIDKKLVASHDGQTIALANGCVCCSIGDNFLRTLLTVVQAIPPPDHIVVEASGVADPARIADIARVDKDLRLDGVIVLADASSLRAQHADSRLADTIERQIDSADMVLLNKTDLTDSTELAACHDWITGRRPKLPVHPVVQANAPLAVLFGLAVGDAVAHDTARPHHVPFETLSGASTGIVSRETLEARLSELSPQIIRAKGIVQTAPGFWSLLQMVGERIEWSDAAAPVEQMSQLVVIGPAPLPDGISVTSLLAP